MRKKLLSLLLAGAMAFGMTACGAQEGGAQTGAAESTAGAQQESQAEAASGEKIINVGVTNTLESLNPLLLNGGEINKYATGLMFLPLMELDADLNFEAQLADSITTEDNKNFIVHIDDAAVWSDGTPITADDVVYTALRLASPVINNTAMMFYVFEGVNDAGFVEAGAESIEGIQKVDDKTVRFTTKNEMPLTTFISTYARYILTLPKHVIEGYSEEELSTADWFNHPDVVSGPFVVTDYDVDHYISAIRQTKITGRARPRSTN
ncbi:MAG: ABC transporter substrate-binding protein [Eisenbergiella sp.]